MTSFYESLTLKFTSPRFLVQIQVLQSGKGWWTFTKQNIYPKPFSGKSSTPILLRVWRGIYELEPFILPLNPTCNSYWKVQKTCETHFKFFPKKYIIRAKDAWYEKIFSLFITLYIQMKDFSTMYSNKSTNWYFLGDEQSYKEKKRKKWNIQIEETEAVTQTQTELKQFRKRVLNLPHKKLYFEIFNFHNEARIPLEREGLIREQNKELQEKPSKDKRSKYEHPSPETTIEFLNRQDKGKNIQCFPIKQRTLEPWHGWRIGLRNGQHICHQVVPRQQYMIQMREKAWRDLSPNHLPS